MGERGQRRRLTIGVAVAGIAIELIAIALVASKQISTAMAVPLLIAGMVMAFIPMFAVARSKRP